MSTDTNAVSSREQVGWSNSALARLALVRRGRPAATLVLLLALCIQIFNANDDYSRIRSTVYDFYHRLSPRKVEELPVIIIDIDERSLQQYGQWPWPRTLMAKLIDKVGDQGVLAIGLDMVFAEPDRSSPGAFAANYPNLPENLKTELSGLPSNDDLLADALRRNRVIVGRGALDDATPARKNAPMTPSQVSDGAAASFLADFPGHLTNIPILSKAAAGFGYVNAIRDPDGVVRRMPVVLNMDNKVAPSMALELLRTALGANWFTVNADATGVQSVAIGDAVLETDPKGQVTLHFSPANPQRKISAADVLSGKIPSPGFAEQIALIGVTGLGLADVATTPVSARLDGVEVQAQFVENLLYGARLKQSNAIRWGEAATLLLSGFALVIITPLVGPVLGALTLGVLLAAQLGGGYWAFAQTGQLFDPAYPALAACFVFMTMILIHITESDRNRRLLNDQLERERLENARMSGELAAARDIQMGILPDTDTIEDMPSNLEVHAFLEPAKEVGGDLYDIFMVDEHRLYFMVGDVSGKGVPASLFMALSKALCKSAVMREKATVADLLATANSEIARENPNFMFVTAVAGIIDARTGAMEFCNAGHDSPYVIGAGKPARPLETIGGPPLCVVDDFPYPVEYAQLEPGETVVLTTDGVNEAMTNEDAMYGTARLIDFLNTVPDDAPTSSIVSSLYKDVKTFVDGAEPNDDITILALKYSTPS